MNYYDHIIRIEHKDGFGLYQEKIRNKTRKHARKFILPMLTHPVNDSCDNVLVLDKNHYTGFKSIDDLRGRFTEEELKIILSHGYRIVTVCVSDFMRGRYIMVYHKSNIDCKLYYCKGCPYFKNVSGFNYCDHPEMVIRMSHHYSHKISSYGYELGLYHGDTIHPPELCPLI